MRSRTRGSDLIGGPAMGAGAIHPIRGPVIGEQVKPRNAPLTPAGELWSLVQEDLYEPLVIVSLSFPEGE